jgi:hypothetical protein
MKDGHFEILQVLAGAELKPEAGARWMIRSLIERVLGRINFRTVTRRTEERQRSRLDDES